MRLLAPALALALACSAPALAQDDAAPSAAVQIAHASRTLAAIWRPITTTTQSALAAACNGASDDLAALDAALPEDLNNRTLAAVHVAHGLVFVPTTENPADTFIFADSSMAWLASGVGVITGADEDTGEITLQDAAQHFGFTVLTLRAEAGRGRLTIYKIGRRYYTTPGDIREMVTKCRVDQKARDFTSIRNARRGSSEMASSASALAAANETVQRLKNISRNTSRKSTIQNQRARQ